MKTKFTIHTTTITTSTQVEVRLHSTIDNPGKPLIKSPQYQEERHSLLGETTFPEKLPNAKVPKEVKDKSVRDTPTRQIF